MHSRTYKLSTDGSGILAVYTIEGEIDRVHRVRAILRGPKLVEHPSDHVLSEDKTLGLEADDDGVDSIDMVYEGRGGWVKLAADEGAKGGDPCTAPALREVGADGGHGLVGKNEA